MSTCKKSEIVVLVVTFTKDSSKNKLRNKITVRLRPEKVPQSRSSSLKPNVYRRDTEGAINSPQQYRRHLLDPVLLSPRWETRDSTTSVTVPGRMLSQA